MPADPNLHPDLDALLDQALATYADAEPDPSLRARIVTRAAQTTSAWSFRRPIFAAIASAAALALALVLLHPQHETPAPKAAGTASTTAPVVSAPSPAVQQTPPAVERVHAIRTVHHVRAKQQLPKLATFPSPSPLTPDEKALIAFTTQHPSQARHVFAQIAAEKKSLAISPVSIQPIAIAALSHSGPMKSGINSF